MMDLLQILHQPAKGAAALATLSSNQVAAHIRFRGLARQIVIVSDGNKVAPSNNFDPVALQAWIDPSEHADVVIPVTESTDSMERNSAIAPTEGNIGDTIKVAANSVRLRSAVPRPRPIEILASAPIGIWEGEVLSVDKELRQINAKLLPLRGSDVEVSGDFSYDQVNPEDRPLVIPGAVFYLEQYSRYVKKQVSYDQRVRFRRLPAWTAEMLEDVVVVAKQLDGNDVEPRIAK